MSKAINCNSCGEALDVARAWMLDALAPHFHAHLCARCVPGRFKREAGWPAETVTA